MKKKKEREELDKGIVLVIIWDHREVMRKKSPALKARYNKMKLLKFVSLMIQSDRNLFELETYFTLKSSLIMRGI